MSPSLEIAHVQRRLGWQPQLPDFRDYPYVPLPTVPTTGSRSLRPFLPPPLDQGDLGSCVANGVGLTALYDETRQGVAGATLPARLFLYYEGRKLERTTRSDSGLTIRDGVKVLVNVGVPPETVWPYDIGKAFRKPSKAAYAAKRVLGVEYLSLDASAADRLTCLRSAIAEGLPVPFGFSVYESFRHVGADGLCPVPGKTERQLGGHCTVAVGIDNDRRLVEVRNSWGAAWGDAGNFWMPFAYILDPQLASDFWVVRKVTA